jgi:hypothetical protein
MNSRTTLIRVCFTLEFSFVDEEESDEEQLPNPDFF